MPAPKIKELRQTPDDDLISAHDKKAESTEVGVAYYIDELARREQNKQTDAMLGYTRAVVWMTIIITIATIANLVITYLLFQKQ